MLLIYNTIVSPQSRDHFDKISASRLFANNKFAVIHLDEKFPSLEKYSHLLLTGSELSASSGSKYDKKIFLLLEHFIKHNKAVLGICHGHQMIARFLAGDKCCRKAELPEFGYRKMNLADDSLFKNIDIPIFLQSHYDEVVNLPKEFRIIAHNDTETVHAFRYKEMPVWGTQFHPEYIKPAGDIMLENHLRQFPAERNYYRDDWGNIPFQPQSLIIFRNFIDWGLETRNSELGTRN